MYSVSQDYLDALDLPVRTYKLAGTVGGVSFDESNVLSIEISNQVSEGSEIKLGSVYIGELTASFYGVTGIARGSWVGKKIILSEGLMLADNSFEYVPLGVYTIAEANHTQEGVDVVAYDAMTNFDKTRNDLTETGTAYDFLFLMCQKCGVTLGMTSADVAALTNGTETLSIYSENDIETWRDLLSWVAQTLCSVATINRAGELELRQYSVSSAATIDETHRFTGCSFSDFTTYYTGMSVVNIALRQTEYKSVTPDDGLTYNLGSNPLVQGDYELVQNIIDEFSDVQLVPFSAQMLGGAIYDLCDCLTFSGGIAAGAVCGVMGFTWKYNGAYAVNGFGSNPALATAKSKAQKDIDAIYNTIGEEINQMSVVQNSSSVTCGESTETSILTYNFEVTQAENTTMVDVSVVMTSSASETEAGDVYTLSDIVAHLSFYVDGSEVSVYDPTFIVDEGKDTMTFNYSLSGLSVGAHQFDVRLTVNGGSGSIAVGDVHELLWGYGITFEVYIKSIEVATMPDKTTFYVGETLDYDGIRVNAVYNNGLTDDVTTSCTFYPDEGTVLDEYDIGALEVNVYYDEFSTEMELEVVRIRLMLSGQSNAMLDTVVSYNGDLFTTTSADYNLIRKKDITFIGDGVPSVSELITVYTFPSYTSQSGNYTQVGTKRISSANENIMTSYAAEPFYYYDFADGTNGTLTATFIHASGSSIKDISKSRYETTSPFEVDGCIVWPTISVTDMYGNTTYCHAVGKISGTSIQITIHDGTLSSALSGYSAVTYVSNYDLEHLSEKKIYSKSTSGSGEITYTLGKLACDGEEVTFGVFWSHTFQSSSQYPTPQKTLYLPITKKAVVGAYATYVNKTFEGYVIDADTGTVETHTSDDYENDPMYTCFLRNNVGANYYLHAVYVPQISKYVTCNADYTDSTKLTSLYITENLLEWETVSGIENNEDAVADAQFVYAPTSRGVLVMAYKNRNDFNRYTSQMMFSNLE